MDKRFIYYIPATSFVLGKGHRVSIVYEGESGHCPTGGGDKEPWYWGNPKDEKTSFELAEQTAASMNQEKLGINKHDALMILASSMRMGNRKR